MDEQKIEYWPIDRVIEYDRNPRQNDHVVDKMAALIKQFGFRVPLLAKSDGRLIDGHLRLKAARKVGLDILPVKSARIGRYMIGMSVPPLMAKVVADAVINQWILPQK